MSKGALTGSRIRSYRIEKGMRQAALARACDISASYLNLIEHNRRKIGGGLLLRIANALEVEPIVLSGGAEVAVASALNAVAEGFPNLSIEQSRAEDFAGRFPGWARLVEAQNGEIRRLERVAEQLGDRLTHDPFLSASMHSVLSSITAIRSASAILVNGEDLEPEWQARFCRNIYEDSQRLTETTETLVRYLDEDAGQESATTLPQDEVDAWLFETGWRCEALECDPDADVETILNGELALQSVAARKMAEDILRRYAEDVRAVPGAALREVLESGPLEMAQRFGVDPPCVFRRLASLPALDLPDGQPFGLVACDGSGTLTYRKPVPGFALPRFSAACPLWPLFQALQRPLTPVLQTVTMAGREEASFEATAISNVTYPLGFGGAAVVEAWMLLKPVLGERTDSQIGTSCRVCSVTDCVARREPSIINAGGL